MSGFLRKLDETLHFPDRLLYGIYSSITQRGTIPDPQKYGGSGKEAQELRSPSPGIENIGATSFANRPYLGPPISPSEYCRMDQAREERSQRGEGGSVGRSSQPQTQDSYGQGSDHNYFEPIEQVGGGSVAGGGGSRTSRMQYSQQMDQGEQGMRIGSMHLSGEIPLHPHHISQDKGAGAEGSAQLQHGSEYQSQPQHSLQKGLGGTQVWPHTEQSYRNPTGSGSGLGGFQGVQPTRQSAGGERDREGEQYGRKGPEIPKGSVGLQGQGIGGRCGYDSREEYTKHEPGDIGQLATHRDVEGNRLYGMQGSWQRELGHPLVRRVYSPAPAATGGAASECTGHGPNDIEIAAYRDIDRPYLYKLEGAGRPEEGRFMRVHEGAAKDNE
ncbi:hypothetical protein BGX38DRAFT_458096 [Terfezia claveryi]|nr:hypothetical protein BGX38DRAFT_458096 [Terfezia claveryi]